MPQKIHLSSRSWVVYQKVTCIHLCVSKADEDSLIIISSFNHFIRENAMSYSHTQKWPQKCAIWYSARATFNDDSIPLAVDRLLKLALFLPLLFVPSWPVSPPFHIRIDGVLSAPTRSIDDATIISALVASVLKEQMRVLW